jgi:hypothetical protein
MGPLSAAVSPARSSALVACMVLSALLSPAAARDPLPPPALSLDFTHVKTPQLIGIICGVIVFTATITAVFVLLCKSGSWSKFTAEMADTGGSADAYSKPELAKVVPSLSAFPELYDNLIQASRSLPAGAVDITALEGREITVQPLDKADVQVLFEGSNGSPQYAESAYDPLRIWGWALLDGAAPPVDTKQHFSDYLDKRKQMTHVSIMHSVYKKPIGMISLSNNNPLHLSIEIGMYHKHFYSNFLYALRLSSHIINFNFASLSYR